MMDYKDLEIFSIVLESREDTWKEVDLEDTMVPTLGVELDPNEIRVLKLHLITLSLTPCQRRTSNWILNQ